MLRYDHPQILVEMKQRNSIDIASQLYDQRVRVEYHDQLDELKLENGVREENLAHADRGIKV